MKVALLTDPMWLMRESNTLRRLVVGLLDEGVRSVRVIPQANVIEQEDLAVTSEQLVYQGSSHRRVRHWQMMRLVESMRAMDVDLIHAMDASLQKVGVKIASALDVPVITSVWSAAELSYVRPITLVPSACAAATPALLDLVQQRIGVGGICDLVAPGVYPRSDDIRPPFSSTGDAISVLIIGNGRLDSYYHALLEAMARVKNQLKNAFYFFYSVTSDQHELWRIAEHLKLLDQVSMAPAALHTRDLLVQSDVVIVPQPLAAARSLVLETLAAARPLLAAPDPMLDYLRDGTTAVIMHDPSVPRWTDVLTQLAADRQPFVRIGESARDYIRQHHSPAIFVEQTLRLYRKLATPDPLPFSSR
jgi:hypothetical protein